MNRVLTVLMIGFAVVGGALIVGRKDVGQTLSPRTLRLSFGSDKTSAKCQNHCAILSGNYVACEKVNGYCRQCGDEEMHQAFGYTTGTPNDPNCGSSGGFQKDTSGGQNCGMVFVGMCVADPSSPTGFACEGANTNMSCHVSFGIIEQTKQGGQ